MRKRTILFLRVVGCVAACAAGAAAACNATGPEEGMAGTRAPEDTPVATTTDCHVASADTCQWVPVDPSDPDSVWMLEDPCCPDLWCPGPLPSPWWEGAVPTECAAALGHEPPQYYDDCFPLESVPERCGVPDRGAITCRSSTSGEGRVTQTCQTTADCPDGMLCMNNLEPVGLTPPAPGSADWAGTCEKRCTGAGGPGECIRCDLECYTEFAEDAFCGPTRPHHPVIPCTADCECMLKGAVCQDGFCNWDTDRPNRGFCPGACACNGGTCENFCCYLPDGGVATGDEPECQQ